MALRVLPASPPRLLVQDSRLRTWANGTSEHFPVAETLRRRRRGGRPVRVLVRAPVRATATPIRYRAQGERLGPVEVGVVGAGLVRVQLGGAVAGDA